MKQFNLIEKAEHLKDYARAVEGEYGRYLVKHEIEDEKNKIYQNWERACALGNNAYYIEKEDEYDKMIAELKQLRKELNGKIENE